MEKSKKDRSSELYDRHVAKIQPYRTDLFVVPGAKDFQKVVKAVYGVKIPNSELRGAAGYVTAIENEVTGQVTFLLMVEKERNETAVWHEALHAAIMILDHVGVKISAKNHEALTYLQGHIVEEIDRICGFLGK